MQPCRGSTLLFAAHNVGGFASAGASGTAQHPLENPMKSQMKGMGHLGPSEPKSYGLWSHPRNGKLFLRGQVSGGHGTNRQNLSRTSPKKEGSDGESFQVGNFQESDSQVVLVTLLATVMGCYLRVHVWNA